MDGTSMEPKEKDIESLAERVPTIESNGERTHPSEIPHRILFAPDPRGRRRSEDITALALTRTFSRQSRFSSYSATSDDEVARARRVTSRKVELHTRLPTGVSLAGVTYTDTVAYRTLSINVTDTVSHGVEPTKRNVKDISELEWHKISVQDVFRSLRCSEAHGLDNDQARRRLQQDGKNMLSPPPTHRTRKM